MMHGTWVAVALLVGDVGASARPGGPASAPTRRITALLVALVLATLLPSLLGAAHAVSYARIPIVPVSLVREVLLVAPACAR